MIHKDIPCQAKPCKDCPFLKTTLKGWLGKKRITEIVSADSFVCHKKTDLQCAGHMLVLKDSNTFYALLTAIFPALSAKMKGRDLVFETPKACIEHHTLDN